MSQEGQEAQEEQKQQQANKLPFISDELRPKIGAKFLDQHPPLEATASKEEMQARSRDLIGKNIMSQLNLNENAASPKMWQQVFARSPEVEWKILEREAVLLNLDDGSYYTLNRVGTAIWELFNGEKSLEDVLGAVCDRFDVAEEVARANLIALVTKLSQEKLIKNGN